jgi:hypothetical protein
MSAGDTTARDPAMADKLSAVAGRALGRKPAAKEADR